MAHGDNCTSEIDVGFHNDANHRPAGFEIGETDMVNAIVLANALQSSPLTPAPRQVTLFNQ